jgi:hypothetical protein
VKAALADKLDKARAQFRASFEARQAGPARAKGINKEKRRNRGTVEQRIRRFD